MHSQWSRKGKLIDLKSKNGNKSTCNASLYKQKRIRKNVYCGQLFDLDERLRSLVPSMCLLRDFGHCVPYYADPGYLTPNQVMESIKLWHQDMVSSHLCILSHLYTFLYAFVLHADQYPQEVL